MAGTHLELGFEPKHGSSGIQTQNSAHFLWWCCYHPVENHMINHVIIANSGSGGEHGLMNSTPEGALGRGIQALAAAEERGKNLVTHERVTLNHVASSGPSNMLLLLLATATSCR